MVRLIQVVSQEDLERVRTLIRAYAEAVSAVAPIRDLEAEISNLPGPFAHPDGCLTLACAEQMPVGCVALQRIDQDVCEMKRLYVKPPFRREGVGRKLALKVIEFARTAGYKRMRLHVLPPMKEATSLYHTLGFRETAPYHPAPEGGSTFMELPLH